MAAAEDYETSISPVDWEDAIEYAELLDTTKDENGVVWETYWDEAQDLMWSQTAGASKDDVIASIQSGEKIDTGGLDYICGYVWLIPYSMTIYDTSSNYETYHYPDDFVYQGGCESGNAVCRLWSAVDSMCWGDVDGYLWQYARNTINYCTGYNAWYWDLDDAIPNWASEVDDEDCYSDFGYTYYEMYETNDIVPDDEDWIYCSWGGTLTGRHRFYACDSWRQLRMEYSVTNP